MIGWAALFFQGLATYKHGNLWQPIGNPPSKVFKQSFSALLLMAFTTARVASSWSCRAMGSICTEQEIDIIRRSVLACEVGLIQDHNVSSLTSQVSSQEVPDWNQGNVLQLALGSRPRSPVRLCLLYQQLHHRVITHFSDIPFNQVIPLNDAHVGHVLLAQHWSPDFAEFPSICSIPGYLHSISTPRRTLRHPTVWLSCSTQSPAWCSTLALG